VHHFAHWQRKQGYQVGIMPKGLAGAHLGRAQVPLEFFEALLLVQKGRAVGLHLPHASGKCLLFLLLLLLNTTRTRSGPPSTRATITMDGGVADTARANTKNSCEHKPLIGKSWGKRERRTSICARPVPPFPRMYSRDTDRTAVCSSA
jgi:hypothetical protein